MNCNYTCHSTTAILFLNYSSRKLGRPTTKVIVPGDDYPSVLAMDYFFCLQFIEQTA